MLLKRSTLSDDFLGISFFIKLGWILGGGSGILPLLSIILSKLLNLSNNIVFWRNPVFCLSSPEALFLILRGGVFFCL